MSINNSTPFILPIELHYIKTFPMNYMIKCIFVIFNNYLIIDLFMGLGFAGITFGCKLPVSQLVMNLIVDAITFVALTACKNITSLLFPALH